MEEIVIDCVGTLYKSGNVVMEITEAEEPIHSGKAPAIGSVLPAYHQRAARPDDQVCEVVGGVIVAQNNDSPEGSYIITTQYHRAGTYVTTGRYLLGSSNLLQFTYHPEDRF